MKDFKSCINEKVIAKDEKDINRVKSLLKFAELRKKFWSKDYGKMYSFLAAEGYYEIIKELLTALLNLHGYKCSNHECLIAFFREAYPKYEYEANAIDMLRKVRNTINYRGVFTDNSYLEKNKLEFNHIIEILQRLIKESLK